MAPDESGAPLAGAVLQSGPYGGGGTGMQAWGSHDELSLAVASQRGSWRRIGATMAEEQGKATVLLGLSGMTSSGTAQGSRGSCA